ncbi:Pyranose 2-oxidase [Colletotrichum siamense]|uniref:Pyranose 2-oxidase n=1 Tax=Colletotrichum siamense TaxID=690259 RepID=A0A9P5EWJ4_COLSI|nr:Pyranose 2-oxidase [Colletotrichum siamense]KAF4860652.1 Pyranose 2-oxidase [Colletotrichum siamense]
MRSVPQKDRLDKVDVLIVGSGPIGAVFARTLVSAGRSVVMIDVGNQESRRIGDHKKNSWAIQKNVNLFTNTVQGEQHPLSIPSNGTDSYLEPASWGANTAKVRFVQNGQNPKQEAWDNIPAAVATRVVGGMGSHWTCNTPRQNKDLERSDLFSDNEWDALYTRAEKLLWTDNTLFDDSIHQQLVKTVLAKAYDQEESGRQVLSMPLCGKRTAKNKNYVEWACTATILGDLAEPGCQNLQFELRANTQCIKLEVNASGQVELALVKDLLGEEEYYIQANKFIMCAGAILTPGILWNSGLQETVPALGHYITEQPVGFCQVVLKNSLIQDVETDKYNLGWKKAVEEHITKHPNDPLPFPFDDPGAQCYFPLTKEHPWHTQIHRDALGYGLIPKTMDQRLVVDLRWFGYTKPDKNNHVKFSLDKTDEFGMPQPTFHFIINKEDSARCVDMITDMIDVARNLGTFLPGAEPKYMPLGSALHVCGTYRAGKTKIDQQTGEDISVVDRLGRVWGQKHLVLGGCGVIPTQNACNPTLTAAAFALAAADQIVKDLEHDGRQRQ